MLNKTRRAKPRSKSRDKVSSLKKQKVTRTKSKGQIKSMAAYDITLNEIDLLMKKGENKLNEAELKRLAILSEAAEAYEDIHDPLPVPSNLPEMIRMKMYQMRLNQGYAAKLLGVSDAKFSMILNGKQKPDIYFVKAVHDKLKVDAKLILKAI